jgi:hypothetical protein
MQNTQDQSTESIRNWLIEHFGFSGNWSIRLISATNNNVYETFSKQHGKYILKIFNDTGIDPNFIHYCNEILSTHLPIQKILKTDTSHKTIPFNLQLSEHIEGRSVADLANEGIFFDDQKQKQIINLKLKLIESIKILKLPTSGFGLYDIKNPTLPETLESYLAQYIEKYAGRIEACFNPHERKHNNLKARLNDQLSNYLKEFKSPTCQVFSFDNNLKNFIYEKSKERFVVLNLPIVGFGPTIQALACVTTSWINSSVYKKLIRSADQTLIDFKQISETNSQLRFFEALLLTGILSFYSKDGKNALLSAKAWGNEFKLWPELLKRVQK